MNLCLPGHFAGNISSLRSESFGKLARICRLLSKVCWEMLPPLLRHCNPHFIYSVLSATTLWTGEFLSADLIYWIRGGLQNGVSYAASSFLWKLYIQLWRYNVWHIDSAFVLGNSGSGALGKQSAEEKSGRDFLVWLWSPVWFIWVTLHCLLWRSVAPGKKFFLVLLAK